MQDFQNSIKTFIKNHEKHKKYIAILIILSLLVVVCVTVSLIKPAISMTSSDDSFVSNNSSSNRLSFSNVYDSNGLENTSVSVSDDGKVTYIDSEGNSHVAIDCNDCVTSITATATGSLTDEIYGNYSLSFSYYLSIGTVSPENPTIYFKLSDNIVVGNDNYTGYVETTEAEFAGQKIGEYFVTTDGYIVITFYNSISPKNANRIGAQYLDYHIYGENSENNGLVSAISGSLTFQAEVSNTNDNKGTDYDWISIGNKNYYFGIPYNLNIEKESSYDKTTRTLSYTVTVSTTKGTGGSVSITDTLFRDGDGILEVDDDSITISKVISNTGTIDVITSYTKTDGKTSGGKSFFTIEELDPLSADESYVLTYTITIPDSVYEDSSITQIEAFNTAIASSKEDTVNDVEAEVRNTIYINYDITKTGSQQEDGSILWTISVKNPYGNDLAGFTITDSQFSDAIEDIIYSNNVTGTLNDDTITLYSTNATEFTITYKTKPTGASILGDTITNKAILASPVVEGSSQYSKTAEASVDYNSIISLEKAGSPDYVNNKVNWTITITNPTGANLNGFSVEDILTRGEISTNVFSDSNINNLTVTGSSDNSISYATDDGTLTFNGDIYDETITITYSTSVSDIYVSQNETNSATLKYGDKGISADGSVEWIPSYSISKSNAVINGSNYSWTITISNPNGANLNGFSVKDILTRGEINSYTFSSNNLTVTGSSGKSISYTIDNDTLTFNEDIYDETITITYTTPIDTGNISGDSVTNTATLYYPNNNGDAGSSSGTGSYSSGLSLEKYVDTDYTNYKFNWTIIINNEQERNLNGFVVEDSAFTSDMSVTVKDADGKTIDSTCYSITDGKLTFSESITTASITITYSTDITDTYCSCFKENTATLKYGSIELGSYLATGKYNSGYSIVKDGIIDNTNDTIAWAITINNTYERNLKGFYIIDTYLNDSHTTNIEVYNGEGNKLSSDCYNISTGDNKITIIGDCYYEKIIITYTSSNISALADADNDNKIINTATLYYGGNTIDTSTKEFPYTTRNEVTKTHGDVSKSGPYITIPWTVDLGQKVGGFKNLVYTDTLSTTGSSDTIHYLTQDQLNAISVQYKTDDETYSTLNSVLYTVTGSTTDNLITGFTITFSESIDDNVTDVRITYNSTAIINNLAVDSTKTYSFNNTAEVNGNSQECSYDFTKKTAYTKYDAQDYDIFHQYVYTTSSQENKTIYDFSQPTSHTTSELDTVTIDEIEYYVLKWHIEVNANGVYGSDEDVTLIDTLPAYATLYNDSVTFTNSNNVADEDRICSYVATKVSTNGTAIQIITFNIPFSWHNGKVFYIDYKALVNKSTLDSIFSSSDDIIPQMTFTNSITDGTYGTVTQELTVTATVIDKSSDADSSKADSNYIGYSIDFNLDEKDLVEGDYVTLVDTLYSDDHYFEESSSSNKITTWRDNGGFKATLRNIHVYSYDDSGELEEIYDYTVELDNNPTKVADTYSAYAAQLTLTVPDSKALRINYTYYCYRLYDDSYYYDGIAIFNKMSIESKYASQTVSTDNIFYLNQTSDALASTGSDVQIEKVDEDNYATKLSDAEFYLYKYDDGIWLPLTDMDNSYNATWGTSEDDTPYKFKTNSDGEASLPKLDEKVLYKLVEVTAPEGYLKSDDVYFFYKEVGTVPTGYDYERIVYPGGNVIVSDSKVDSVDITATKLWDDEDSESHDNDSVTFELYQSHTAPPDAEDEIKTYYVESSNGVLDDNGNTAKYKIEYNTTQNTITIYIDCLNTGSDKKIEFDGIKDISDFKNLNMISYSFSDISDFSGEYITEYYKSSGNFGMTNTCEPTLISSMSGNIGFNLSSDKLSNPITITLKVTKSSSTDEVTFNEHGIPSDAELVTDSQQTVNVNNNWKCTWENLPSKDTEGTLYYYVKEISYIVDGMTTTVPDTLTGTTGYRPVYTNNGLTSTDIVKVTNIQPIKIDVEKIWKNYDGTLLTDVTTEVQVRLWQSSTKTDDSSLPSESDRTLITSIGTTDIGTQGEDGIYDGVVTLNQYNSYKYSFEGLEPTDTNGNPIYYYIEEISIDGYNASYSTNGVSSSDSIEITNTPKTGSITLNKEWYFYNSESQTWESGTPTGKKVTFKIYQSTTEPTAPSGRYTQSVTLNYGSNSITLDSDTWEKISDSTIEEITIKADTTLFNGECSTSVTIAGQTTNISSGSATIDGGTISDETLTINSESATAIKQIVIKFTDGQCLTITNIGITQVEKPAGTIVYEDLSKCTGDNKMTNGNAFGSEGKCISDVKVYSSELSYGACAYVKFYKFNGQYDVYYYYNNENGDYNNSYYSVTVDTNTLYYGYEIGGWSGNYSINNVIQMVITFTDGTTYTLINGTNPSEELSTASLNDYDSSYTLSRILGFNVVGNSEEESESSTSDDTVITPSEDMIIPSWKPTTVTEDALFDKNIMLDDSIGWEYTIDNLPLMDSEGNPYYYYIEEVAEDNSITVSYDTSNGVTAGENSPNEVTILNYSHEELTEMSITVKKEWVGNPTDSITAEIYQSTELSSDGSLPSGATEYKAIILSDANNWSQTITNLPIKNEEGDTNVRYYYYVVEDVPNGYTVSYSANGLKSTGTVTITNAQSGSLDINKKWVGENGDMDDDSTNSDITVEIYRKSKSEVDSIQSLKIMALGDSITNGYGSTDGKNYPAILSALLTENGYNLDSSSVRNEGYSGYAIKNMPDNKDYTSGESRSGIYEYIFNNKTICNYNPDIVLLQIGTNDIISNYNNNIENRLEELVKEIYNQSSDTTIFLASIPDFDIYDYSSIESWFNYYKTTVGNVYGFHYDTSQYSSLNEYINSYVKAYNEKIENLVSELQNDYSIYFVDINSTITETADWSDGCHPSNQGYTKMANYWYGVLDSYLTTPDTNIDSSAPEDAEFVKTVTISSSDNWSTTISDLPLYDEDGNAYVYYVTEQSVSGYKTIYSGNGVKLNNSDASNFINIINFPDTNYTNISVQKQWNDTGIHDNITVVLHRSTTKPSDDSEETTTSNKEEENDDTSTKVLANSEDISKGKSITYTKDTDFENRTISSVVFHIEHNESGWEWATINFDGESIKAGYFGTDVIYIHYQNTSYDGTNICGNCDSGGNIVITFKDNYQPNQIIIYTENQDSAVVTLTINYEDTNTTETTTTTESSTTSSTVHEATSGILTLSDSDFIDDCYSFELSSTYDWIQNIKVPIADSDGNTYYYWIEEVIPNGYATPQYVYNESDETDYYIDANYPDGKMVIINTKEDTNSNMPSTGGIGTGVYQIVGIIVVVISTAGLYRKRRSE